MQTHATQTEVYFCSLFTIPIISIRPISIKVVLEITKNKRYPLFKQ
jgi:hypothetical protein